MPISITSITGDQLEKTGLYELTDLQYVVPGVTYDPTQGAAFQIRGVGSTSFDMSNEKSVNVVVDDVVMDNQRDNGLIGLTDVARVDVLMGPQGTLFGKNSTSGVISITTNMPELGTYSGNFYGSYGERNDHNLNGTVNVPIGQNAALRVSGFEIGQDGFGKYTQLDKSLGLVHEYGVRGKLLYQTTDNLQIVLAGEYTHHYDTSVRTYVGGPAGTSFSASDAILAEMAELGVKSGTDNVNSADNHFGRIISVNKGGSLHVSYDLGSVTLTSITAYREATYINDTPADLLPDNVNAYLPFNIGYLYSKKFSEEVHIASPTGHFFEYLIGAFYNRLTARQDQVQWGPLGAGPVYDEDGVGIPTLYANSVANDPTTGAMIGNTRRMQSYNETAALFGQTNLNFSPQLKLTLGARYNYDWNGQTMSYFDTDPLALTGYEPSFIASGTAPPADFRHGGMRAGHFTYRIAPQWAITPDIMAYATYSTGYKPGGIAFVGNKYDPYGAETVKSWEAGVKSEFLNHRVRFNFDVYSSKYKDFQATILTPVISGDGTYTNASAIGNAPGLRSRGFETSLAVKPTRDLLLGGAVTYTNAVFTNYVASPTANYTGTQLTNAPHWMFTINADYDRDISSSLKVKAHVDYAYRSSTQTVTGALLGDWTAPARQNADGTTTPNASYSYVPSYGLVNARASIGKIDGSVEMGIYARNLFNKYFSTGYQVYGTLGLLHYTTPAAYRTLGVYLEYKF
ncbi:TonB-dependent receptor [Novosphingobium sp. 9]|uniref:TonB-dependent receptor n=1 Tax=Novosphingobium sp. 9 TaxID=2025349 RepID=UPI0021B59AE9|nr:TonB-dependent receptor [Novosphingobium sp. 9]